MFESTTVFEKHCISCEMVSDSKLTLWRAREKDGNVMPYKHAVLFGFSI